MGDVSQSLADRAEIIDVCVRYALALDARDWPSFRSCFVPDVTAEYEGLGPIDGLDALEEVCRQALGPLTASQHLLGNHRVELQGDEARSTCYLQAQHVRAGLAGGDKLIVAGTYTDRFVRRPEGWRIAHRRLDVVWTDGNSAVLGV